MRSASVVADPSASSPAMDQRVVDRSMRLHEMISDSLKGSGLGRSQNRIRKGKALLNYFSTDAAISLKVAR